MSHSRQRYGTMAAMALLPIQEAAVAEGISTRQLHRWIGAGRISKYEKRGDRRTYVDTDEIRRARGFRRVSGPKQ